MKAKMSTKAPEKAVYLCIWCDFEFDYVNGPLVCPECGNSRLSDIIPIYMEESPSEEMLYTKEEWHGG